MKIGRKTHVFIGSSAAALFKLLDRSLRNLEKDFASYKYIAILLSTAVLFKLLDRSLYNLEKDLRLYKYIAILLSTAVLVFRSRQRL